jgi:hypothetical protein
MHRIDNATAIAALPAPEPVGTPGFFTNGNRPAGLAPTRVDDNWLNTVQEEIANVVLAAGLQLSKVSNTQLYEAIQAIAYGANPDLSAYLPLSGGTLSNPGNLTVGGALTVTGGVTAAQSVAVSGNLQFAGTTANIVKMDNGNIVLTGSAGGQTALVQFNAVTTYASGNLSVVGQVNAEGAILGNSLFAAGAINGNGTLGILGNVNFHQNLDVAGNGNFGTLGCFGNATINGSISTTYLGCNGDANITGTGNVGWINSAGDFAITAGGAFSSNGGQIDICQTGTRGNVGLIRLAGNFVQSGGTHDVYGDLRVTGTIVNPWQPPLSGDDAIAPYERGLAEIRQLAPVIYDHRRRLVGLALDDCREVMPEMVSRVTDHAGETTEGLNTGALSYALVNAVRELADRVEVLERRPAPLPA